jgi:D-alanyl-D-alanine carboxypeptidase
MPNRRCLLLLAVAIGAAGAVVGCGSADDGDGDTQHGVDWPTNATGLPATAPPLIQPLVDDYVEFSGEPGVQFGFRFGDGPAQLYAAGDAVLQSGAPLAKDALFRVGSNTKPFVAVVLMQLISEGKLGLDDEMVAYLPQYKQWSGVKIRHLLGMASGIPDYLTNPIFWLNVFIHLGEVIPPEEIVFYATCLPMMFEPGSSCFYSNTNYVLLGMVIQAVTGNSPVEEIRRRVTEPLGLRATHLDLTGEHINALTHGYADSELAAPVFGLDEALTSLIDLIPPAYIVEGTVFDGTYLFHPSFSYTAGALVSNAQDLLTFMRAYVDGELVEPDLFAQMTQFRPCSVVGEIVDYGMAMMRRETAFGTIYGHGGKHFGYSAFTYRQPEQDLTFCALNNFVPEQMPWFYEDLMGAALGAAPSDPQRRLMPNDFFAIDDQNVHLRFRGAIDRPNIADPPFGLCYAQALVDDDWRPFYGLGCRAQWRPDESGDRVVVVSEGPGLYDGPGMRRLQLELDPALLGELDDERTIDLAPLEADRASPFIYDVRTRPDTGEEVSRCLIGVPDLKRGARLAINGPGNASLALGDQLELYAALMVNLDPIQVQRYADEIARPRCECKSAVGVWSPCGE